MRSKFHLVAWVVFLALGLAVAASNSSQANWLSRLGRGAAEIGEGAGKAGKLGLGALDAAAAYVAKLPPPASGAALAAHATPEGHWKFVNRDGEIFTAGNAEELARAPHVLAPGLGGGKLAIYLSEDSVFLERARLGELAAEAELHVVTERGAYALRKEGRGSGEKLYAEVRPNISVELTDRVPFDEAVFQLARPLNRANIRVLALEPGGPRSLASVPGFDRETKAALVDRIDPAVLAPALAKAGGQTVLISGRVDGDTLHFLARGGSDQHLSIPEIVMAAEASDVNVVILNSAAARQPGGRNWLWQRIEVAGLDEALGRATFADFLNALAAKGGELTVTAAPASAGRITLRAVPSGGAGSGITDTIGQWMSDITGNVVVEAAEVHARSAEREQELDARFIPGIPSALQIAYLAGLAMGVLALAMAWRWWQYIWPPEQQLEYRSALGYHAARAVRVLAFSLVFLPLAGGPALISSLLAQIWLWVTASWRFLGWLWARFAPKTG